MKLTCYKLVHQPAELVPGAPDRDWMDGFTERHPYRCLPLVIANTTGWALLSPVSFNATWNGGLHTTDILIEPTGDTRAEQLPHSVVSHFTSGVLTFHTGYLFRTEPEWDLLVSGPPNHLKDGIQPLTGIVETYWLPFPFTMNWRFTRPGTVSFEKDEPFCFLMPVPHTGLEQFQPVVKSIDDDPELKHQFQTWDQNRGAFIERLEKAEHGDATSGWQRDYFLGRTSDGNPAPAGHVNRRRMKAPRMDRPRDW